ncbi:hypothetical protein L484_005502 [Morus notabilis]|uniref:Uncharacterized protein n=1 Tax=Morus notabilis TaxID=981085 RepID=W9RVK7_9ROSA|nr:hypothetical protein L484_005502 [Morus notabilis]
MPNVVRTKTIIGQCRQDSNTCMPKTQSTLMRRMRGSRSRSQSQKSSTTTRKNDNAIKSSKVDFNLKELEFDPELRILIFKYHLNILDQI